MSKTTQDDPLGPPPQVPSLPKDELVFQGQPLTAAEFGLAHMTGKTEAWNALVLAVCGLGAFPLLLWVLLASGWDPPVVPTILALGVVGVPLVWTLRGLVWSRYVVSNEKGTVEVLESVFGMQSCTLRGSVQNLAEVQLEKVFSGGSTAGGGRTLGSVVGWKIMMKFETGEREDVSGLYHDPYGKDLWGARSQAFRDARALAAHLGVPFRNDWEVPAP